MARFITAVAFLAATGTAPVLSQAEQLDLRCVETDQAMTQRIREALARDDGHTADMAPLNMAMARIASARIDCRRGRIERGLETYTRADTALRAFEEATLARTARSGATR